MCYPYTTETDKVSPPGVEPGSSGLQPDVLPLYYRKDWKPGIELGRTPPQGDALPLSYIQKLQARIELALKGSGPDVITTTLLERSSGDKESNLQIFSLTLSLR